MKRPFRAIQCVLVVGAVALSCLATGTRVANGDGQIPIEVNWPIITLDTTPAWDQPPLERDVLLGTPVFCGWDEGAYSEEMPTATQRLASCPADDFRGVGPMPITRIRWWGSFKNWRQTKPPAIGPEAWRITFSANVPADSNKAFSRPGTQISQFEVSADQVSMKYVGLDRFPGQVQDSCFLCSLTLDAADYFWPSMQDGDIFWISIVGVYKTQKAEHVWGWKTRPRQWMDGAVKYVSEYDMLPSGQAISSIVILPVQASDACGQNTTYDMAFALDTDPGWEKWLEPFTGLQDWPGYADEASTGKAVPLSSIAIKWQQEPDTGSDGLDIDGTADVPRTWPPQILADDYQCTQPGPVTQIWLWGSYYLDELPGDDPCNVGFVLSIRADVPASNQAGGYSVPGQVLWTKTFKKGQFAVQESTSERQGFYSPCNATYTGSSDQRVFKYTFQIDPSEAFVQTGTSDKPVVYWLSVQAGVTQSATSKVRFGWKTSASSWNDDAVWTLALEPYSGSTWQELRYPASHPRAGQHTALAFTIITSDQTPAETIDRQVADDWQSEGTSPVAVATWWGSYLGYTDHPCQCNTLADPIRPDYFLLTIWSNGPRASDQDHLPGQKLWQYRAYHYDEVQVGSDAEPNQPSSLKGHEPVFRYTVNLPSGNWFTPDQGSNAYWFSVVAMYESPHVANYPWGWTSHEHVWKHDAVAGSKVGAPLGKKIWSWDVLGEDMSFVLFQQAMKLY